MTKFVKLISYIFHPILTPIIGTLLYFIILPRHTSKTLEITILLYVFFGTYFLPLIFLSVLKKFKVIRSFLLSNPKERRLPLLFIIFTTSLLGTIFYRNGILSDLVIFFYGSTVSLAIAYVLLYKNFKTSLHLVGIGGLIGFILFCSYEYNINNLLLISCLFVLTGVIAFARLRLKAHNQKEIYLGFLIGICSQITVYIYNI